MQMDWDALLFAHWPVRPDFLRDLLPPGLELDTWGGDAWIGLVPFRMNRVRARGAPTLPGMGTFPELNLRTYVRREDRAGVWFLSLDASSALAVRLARMGFGLPYFDAQLSMIEEGERVTFAHRRTQRGAWPAELRVVYQPSSEVLVNPPGSLEYFLTERYSLYSWRRGQLLLGEVAHAPWPLRQAQAEFEINTLWDQLHLPAPGTQPLLHASRALRTVAWEPRPVGVSP